MFHGRGEVAALGTPRREHGRGLSPEAAALVLALVILIALTL